MARLNRPRTRIERAGADRARTLRLRISEDVRVAREDAGLSLRHVSRVAGISHSTLHALEHGRHDPTTEVLARVAEALGMDLSVRLYPGSGPLIRDHLQSAMLQALVAMLDDRWRATPEVWVRRPVRGVIDIVLEAPGSREPLVAVEAHSELRRLEQQVRWAQAKAAALAEARGRPAERLLLLRATRHMRAVVSTHAELVGAAFPAPSAGAYSALAGAASWPGPAIVWCDVEHGQARIRPRPPRGITVGR
jgi:transcriptional regulator with XRE-family HTH domain